jgi:hypothetical protein
MIGNLKAVGLTVIAIFAGNAVAASSAWAIPEFQAESTPSTLTGAQTNAQSFTFMSGTVTCSAAKLEGELTKVPTITVTLTPTYTSCFFNKTIEVAFTTNGCAYVMTLKIFEPAYEASAKIECPAGSLMEIDVPNCTIKIGAQEGLVEIPIKNENEGMGNKRDVKMEMKLSMLEYSQKGIGCENKLFNNGVTSGGITLKAEKGKSEPVGLWVA